MRKIILLLIMFTFLGCGETKIEKKALTEEKTTTKKESIKDTITLGEVLKNDELKKIVEKNFNNDMEFYEKCINYENNFDVVLDEFNLQHKMTHSKANKNDKIQLILYSATVQDGESDKILAKDIDIRGDVVFNLRSHKHLAYNKIIILTDNNRYSIDTPPFSRESDWNKEYIQTCKIPFNDDIFMMLADIAHSKKVRIRFSENDKHMDFSLSEREINNIKELVLYYTAGATTIVSIHEYLDTL